MKNSMKVIFAATAAFAAGPAFGQSMVGQAHDFSGNGWAGGEICKPCHAPHNAPEAVNVGYLWNHELTTATYTLYDNTTAPAGPDDGTAAFDVLSRLCMGCHDGTVAIDSFGGATGSSYANGGILVGTDLTNDHPVGRTAVYPEEGTTKFNAADGAHTLGGGALKLREMQISVGVFDYTVGCMTCHTPHYKGFDMQLRMSNASSALCLACHIK